MNKRVYLDWAAAAPATDAALRAFVSASKSYGNPSAAHEDGRAGKAILEKARATIGHLAGAKPEAVIFTSGATEANAIAIRGHVRAIREAGRKPESIHLAYVEGAHASVSETMQSLKADGINVDSIPLREGAIDLTALASLLRPDTALVSVEAISSETGARFDTKAVRQALDAARAPGGARIYLHVDASQLPLVESFERTRLSADLLTLDAQKVGGVRGAGVLIVAPNVPLAPVIDGGGQERGLRSGTETPTLANAFATALVECAQERESFAARAALWRAALVQAITTAIPNTLVNEGKKNAPHIVNFSFLGRDTDFLAALLDERGFSVSTRSACETDSIQGSRAVRALTKDAARAISTLRISLGPATHENELKQFAKALISSVAFIDQNTL